jgi:hypothetical protein
MRFFAGPARRFERGRKIFDFKAVDAPDCIEKRYPKPRAFTTDLCLTGLEHFIAASPD